MFMTEDEILLDLLLYRTHEKDKKALKETDEEDLILFHHTVGQWIRNHYQLWDKANPYVVHDDAHHENFPDQMSQRIIERMWCQLSGKKLTFKMVLEQHPSGAMIIKRVSRD